MPVKPKTIRLGIIGCGRVAEERHFPALQYLPDIQVVAVADIDTDRLDFIANRYGIEQQFSDYRALLDRANIDAVGILTPTQSHAEIGLAALGAAKHVMVEKPLALNLAECEQLIARGADSSCKMVVGLNLRWHRLLRRAREFIQNGKLGRIKAIRSVFTHYRSGENAPYWHRKRKLGGGIIFNEAVHHFDLWRYLLQIEVEQVFAYTRPSPYYEDETLVTNALLSNGVLATGVFTLKTSPTSEVEIYGENGRLYLSLYQFDGFEFFSHTIYPGNITDRLKKSLCALFKLPKAIPIMRRGGDFQETFYGLWQHFADCINRNIASECTLEDGKRALQVSLAALESVLSRQPVQIIGEG